MGGRNQLLLPLVDRLARDAAVLGNRHVTVETILEGQLEVAPSLLTRAHPQFNEEGIVGQLVEGELGPGINQLPVFGRQFVLIKGVLTGRDAALLVTEKVEEAPADLPKGVGHQPPLLHSGRDRFRVVRKDLGEDQTPLLEEVAVVIAVDRDAETFKDAVDESRSLITV